MRQNRYSEITVAVILSKYFLEGNAPLARATSMSSCAGYHTPIEDEVAGDGLSDLPSDLGLLTSRGGSFLHTQVLHTLISADKTSTLTYILTCTHTQMTRLDYAN